MGQVSANPVAARPPAIPPKGVTKGANPTAPPNADPKNTGAEGPAELTDEQFKKAMFILEAAQAGQLAKIGLNEAQGMQLAVELFEMFKDAPAGSRYAEIAGAAKKVIESSPLDGQGRSGPATAKGPKLLGPKQPRGLIGHFQDIFIGGGQAIGDMVKGIGNLIAHPLQSGYGILYGLTHWGALFHAFVDPYTQALAEGRPGKALGRGIVEVGSFFIGAGAGGAAAKGGSKVVDIGSKVGRVSKVPAFTKAAQLAIKEAGLSKTVANAGFKAARVAYVEARAAGQADKVAKLAAAAKAAKAMGLAKNATVVEKIVNSARLSQVTAKSATVVAAKTLSRSLPKAVNLGAVPVGKGIVSQAGTYVASGVKYVPQKLGNAATALGGVTIGQIVKPIVTLPFKLPVAAAKGVGNMFKNAAYGLAHFKIGEIAALPGRALAGTAKAARAVGAMSIGELIASPFKLPGLVINTLRNAPKKLIRPIAGIGIGNRIGQGALAEIGGPKPNPRDPADGPIGEKDLEEAAKMGLEATKENVAALQKEVATYKGTTIGPDTGTPEEVKQLQTLLRTLGYDVDPTGAFDKQTAGAVIDFKTKHGLAQTYKLAGGKPAFNEYVNQATIDAMLAAANAGEKAGDPPKSTPPSDGTNPSDITGGKPGEIAADKPVKKPDTSGKPGEIATDKPVKKPDGTAAEGPPSLEVAPIVSAEPAQYNVTSIDRATGLSGIARRYLGNARRWKEIYDLNRDTIGNNPNLIVPGQKLKLPPDAKNLPADAKNIPGAPVRSVNPKIADEPAPTPSGNRVSTTVAEATTPSHSTTPPKEATVSQEGLTDEEVARLAKENDLLPDRANVEAFVLEVNGYRENGLGPDVGSKEKVKELQEVLAYLHFPVKPTGIFDEATAKAVIDFKIDHGIGQTYKLSNGNFAANQYVNEATVEALMAAALPPKK